MTSVCQIDRENLIASETMYDVAKPWQNLLLNRLPGWFTYDGVGFARRSEPLCTADRRWAFLTPVIYHVKQPPQETCKILTKSWWGIWWPESTLTAQAAKLW
jgi:hypothetical protein